LAFNAVISGRCAEARFNELFDGQILAFD